ncbi:transcription-repair coupling factor [Haliangium sp.]|uniref:transcription-repair coupling factor n=1 Tax=Haliangium sp. TaxID=2663208 RepID=UPI003D110F74
MAGASLDELVAGLAAERDAPGPIRAHGLTRPAVALVAARLAASGEGAPVVVVTPDDAGARHLAEDIGFFVPPALHADARDPVAPGPVLHVPASDTSPYADLSADRLAQMARMGALFRLARGGALSSPVVVLSAPALLRRVMPKPALLARAWTIAVDGEIDRDGTVRALSGAGYERTTVVEDPGSFAVRGGVIDVFTPLYRYPARIELFGDLVESIRLFDPDSQRTLRALDELWLHPARETIVTEGADWKGRIRAAADAAHHPSTETRRVLERIDAGEPFVGIDTLTPAFHAAMAPLWEYLPESRPEARWLIVDPDLIFQVASDELDIADARYAERIDDSRLAFPPEDHYLSLAELGEALSAAPRRIEVRSLEVLHPGDVDASSEDRAATAGATVRFAVDDNRLLCSALERARRQNADELMKPLVEAIAGWRGEHRRVAVAAGTMARARQLAGLLGDYECGAEVSEDRSLDPERLVPGAPPLILAGDLSAGFSLPADGLVLLTADEIFGARRRTSARQRDAAKRARRALAGLDDFSQIQPGDHLVHELHGIGQYKGLTKLPVSSAGPPIDFLHIEYRGGQLYLPVYRLGEVQRYMGAEGHAPRLDKLGGTTWQTARRKVSRQIKALAEELLKLYAQRAALPGHAFPPADAMFHEFEATFAFEETPDQERAIAEVLADMEAPRPMDRLVCGDVGYGKTEVALRACFKAVQGGRQAALLAPTTVLVEQHYRTLRERFEGWPVTVARLSRFQPRAEQLATIKGLAAGSVDIVVGTHRLLSKDVRFKELGVIVVDEEQRFGVAHKEKLKRVRTQLDVLTLTATPIPRTLHLAMSGLRDLSIIATPPADRRSIRTFVSQVDDGVLREGIRRELGRGGQVFVVCPRIGASPVRGQGGQGSKGGKGREVSAPTAASLRRRGTMSLEQWAEHLRGLVPEAKVAVAHGQLSAEALEQVMVGFVAGDSDILVSTTIVESGLDIARANTMFIDRADSFGLAQLYQLRGRIGRSTQRAFCYLLVPPPEKLTPEARRRLETLQRFSELGAGFQIASHDLEIRGGGELLGAKQSGAIAAVGFETYAAMLEEAVSELKGQGDGVITRPRDPELNVDVPGFIPDDYVPDTGQRLDLYKRLSDADDEDEVRRLVDEIGDRYGAVPDEVSVLADLMVLKVHARTLRALSLELSSARMSLALAEDTPLAPERVAELVRGRGWRLLPDQRLLRRFSAEEARAPAASARRCLLELAACAT